MWQQRTSLAWRDLAGMARYWRLIVALGGLDIRLRYRGSWLGPFWLSLSTAIMIASLGLLYPALFRLPAAEYVPYLAISLVLWQGLSQLVTDGCAVFVQQEAAIHATPLPFSVHVARALARNLLALAHQSVVLLGVFLLFEAGPGAAAWMIAPALALWVIDGFFLLLLLGLLSARFRDIPPIVVSLMQLGFFVTPIIWRAEQIGAYAPWLALNPCHALIEVLRAPLLGAPASGAAWAAALAASAILIVASIAAFVHARPRLAFWV